MKYAARLLLFATLWAFPMAMAGGETSEPGWANEAGLSDLLWYAAENSPEMRRAFEEWRAAVERVPQARSLADPELTYGYFLQRMETRQVVGLMQAFPAVGVRGMREEMAEQQALAAAERFEAVRRQVRAEVKIAYADYAYALAAVGILERSRDLVARLEGVVRGMLQAGRAGAADVLRIESELDRIGEELQTGRHQVVPAAAELNRALGRSSWAPLPEFGLPTVETLSLEREDLLREALQHNPRLRASDYQLAAGEQGVQLAGREKYPGFRAGVEWMENPGRRDEVRATVGISLPIWRERYAAAEREARAVREGVRHERAALGQELESRLAMAIFRLRNAERKERLYRESLVPRARATVEAVEGAYRGGRANFLELVDSQRTLIALELAQAEVLAEQFQRWAELEELAGADAMANGPGRADERPTD